MGDRAQKAIELATKMKMLQEGTLETFTRDDDVPMVCIPRTHFLDLVDDAEMLSCLDACGVDNWQDYGDAVRMKEGEDVD